MSTLVTCHKCFQTIREIGGDEFGVHIHELCHACQMELVSKLNNTVFKAGTSDPATPEEIDELLGRLNRPGLDKRPAGK